MLSSLPAALPFSKYPGSVSPPFDVSKSALGEEGEWKNLGLCSGGHLL